MSACPSCGAQAPDDARFCANCGARLKDAPTPESPEATTPEPDAPEPEAPVADDAVLVTAAPEEPAPSPALARGERKGAGFGVLLLLVAIAGLVVGATVWALSFKDPCEGKFASDRFAYCLSVPQGWQASPARIGSAEVDQFAKPTGVGVVIVQSQPLDGAGDEAAQLETYAQQLRDQSEEAGMEVGAANEATLDGHDALVWSATSTTAEGDDFEQVQLATTQNGSGWSISLTDSAGGIETTRPAFQDMLETWRFA